ncbi:MAG TPA: electron transfer flavoprotein subunit beta/FixA family protein [Pseudobacteroides sp.]|uniref:electron transfer flavoprotein subunit beta/FixA family protein n=1 Tax=Pseudobacteroides sp. TaxID=1968840 RepID=UPI002F92B40D
MNVIVCVKQVPATNEIKIDNETKTIIREGMEAIINPFDMYAVEEALRIKEKSDGKVTVISMGIPSVAEILKKMIALGADEAILLSDKAFAGADSLATAYTLSLGIEKIGAYDLVICGNQAIDGDTAQVGPSLAEKLGIPHTTCVRRIEEISKGRLSCQRLTEDGFDIVEMQLPALLTVVKEINEPRNPTLKGMKRAKETVIKVWNAEDLEADKDLCGLKGSATQVVNTFIPEHDYGCEIINGTLEEQVKRLADRVLPLCFDECK